MGANTSPYRLLKRTVYPFTGLLNTNVCQTLLLIRVWAPVLASISLPTSLLILGTPGLCSQLRVSRAQSLPSKIISPHTAILETLRLWYVSPCSTHTISKSHGRFAWNTLWEFQTGSPHPKDQRLGIPQLGAVDTLIGMLASQVAP